MGIVRMGPPVELILQLQAAHAIRHFVETGTYLGQTAYWASQFFEHVTTIEFSESLYERAKTHYAQIKNLQFLYGHSLAQLRTLVPHLDSAALFWLDAHWSGGETYGANDECPLLDEIEIINQSEFEHFILIDDARLFTAPPPPPHQIQQWPDISQIVQALNACHHKRYIVVVEDVILAVPESAKALVAHYGQQVALKEQQTAASQSAGRSPLTHTIEVTGEADVIGNLPFIGPVVFDVGANVGSWTASVLNQHPNAQIHAFEPVPQTYYTFLQNLAAPIQAGRVFPANVAIAHQEEIRTFHAYETASAWSTFHRRVEVEQSIHLAPPTPLSVFTTTLDRYCQQRQVMQIGFLKIDVEGGELDVLLGATELLKRGRIDYIQFEYGGTWKDAHTTLKQAFEYLQSFRYHLFKILPDGLEYRPQFSPSHEDFEYSNFLAVSDRLRPLMFGEEPRMLDLKVLCQKYGIAPRNVIHVGAHEGQEIHQYQQMDVPGVLFVEANPALFERLETNLAGIDNMLAIQCAVSDRNGTVTLHVTSEDQSSSILPLKHHQDLYPGIQETHQVEVPSTTLDDLLDDLQLDTADFNLLYLDIQGAELLALQGAAHLLHHIDAINTEINYEELYEGCALIHQIDEFLEAYGFERVETTTPYHPSWGDAFYVKKPVITMSTLGRNGRFANQFFQYAFLKTYAKLHNLRVETSPWIGQYLFGQIDSEIAHPLPVVGNPDDSLPDLGESLLLGAPTPYQNVEFWGYFQYHTRFYVPHKAYIRSLFQPVPEVEEKLRSPLQQLRSKGKTVIGLHLRRGDYGYYPFFIAPSQWYLDWLKGFWETLDEPVLFIASDEPETVVPDFADYHPITSQNLNIELPEASFYPDFYLLSQCDVVAISNSSFSFAACMLNERGTCFFRPHRSTQKLIPFDPWNSEPLLK
ncbi:MAG TPA: FkbM family methyltransferase [Crinalium sp.]|jgi:FkbM family methyltransferase